MYLISADGYINARVHILTVKKTGEIWVSMKNLPDGLGVKIMSGLILKEIYGRYGTKNLTEEQIRRYKMTERRIYKKYDSLSENELNKKSNKKVYVKKDVMIFVIKHCRGEKKEVKKEYMDLEQN